MGRAVGEAGPSLPFTPGVPLQSSPTHPQHPFPTPPVKRMTKDLSYAGSKNQNFLLAFSFVASPDTPLSQLPPWPQAGSPPFT